MKKKESKPFKDMLSMTEASLAEFKKNPVPMKKETLEEAAENYAKWRYPMLSDLEYPIRDFITGAKWQQQGYSEEDLREAIHESRIQDSRTEDYIFEQFKKK